MSVFQGALTYGILIPSCFLLGAFYVHWIVDHATIWTPAVLDKAVQTSLEHYAHIFKAPPTYIAILGGSVLIALVSSAVKVLSNGTKGMLFDGASALLLSSAMLVYLTNLRRAIEYLPFESLTNTPMKQSGLVTEALQSIAASHMIIAVSLTGVVMLQAAQGYSDRSTNQELLAPKPAQSKK